MSDIALVLLALGFSSKTANQHAALFCLRPPVLLAGSLKQHTCAPPIAGNGIAICLCTSTLQARPRQGLQNSSRSRSCKQKLCSYGTAVPDKPYNTDALPDLGIIAGLQ